MEDAKNDMDKFRNEFEELVKKFKIEKYVLVYDDPTSEEEKLSVLYKPQDIMEITRLLKNTHSQFLRQVMINVGEVN